MEEGNVLALREMFRAWNERRPRDVLALFDELVVWDARGLAILGVDRVYFGPEQTREFWRDWLPSWSDIQVEIEWIESPGDRVVAWLVQRMVGRESGVELVIRYGWDTSWRDDKLIRVSFTTDEAEARRRAGRE